MSLASRLTFIALWVLSVLVVGVIVSVSAQTPRDVIPPPRPPAVISGQDLGFVPDGWKGKARTGRFVVRINGEWVDILESAAARTVPVVQ